MFEEENLLKFEPFLFKNGAVPKPKCKQSKIGS